MTRFDTFFERCFALFGSSPGKGDGPFLYEWPQMTPFDPKNKRCYALSGSLARKGGPCESVNVSFLMWESEWGVDQQSSALTRRVSEGEAESLADASG